MDAATTNNLITAGAGLLGALVGGSASIWATNLTQRSERKAEIEREGRADERQRRDAADQRAHAAAIRCDQLLSELAVKVRQWYDLDAEIRRSTHYFDVLQSSEADIEAEAQYLPPHLGARVDEALRVLHQGEHIWDYFYARQSLGWVAHTLSRETHRVMVAWQRGESLPARTADWCDLLLAAEHAEADFEELMSEHVDYEIASARASWRNQHEDELRHIEQTGRLDRGDE